MAVSKGIPDDVDYEAHGGDMRDVWASLSSRVFKVVDDEGNNVADAAVRHMTDQFWLYVDEVGGYEVMTEESVNLMWLEHGEE